ncbi:MAG: putative toxin-antitoxin system toxin component, PIN family [candidate division Zixibacteria bacterium]|nr:putative toxin-antitoxin system toxin component, PIN family [candidate division Zixibacteria bacterium]
MIKAVYDTNIIVSGIIARGRPYILLNLVYNHLVELFVSPALLEEYETVLKRPKFKPFHQEIPKLLDFIKEHAKVIKPKIKVDRIPEDLADNRILECALEGKVDYIVTGNKKHSPFKEFEKIKVVDPGEFLMVVGMKLFK